MKIEVKQRVSPMTVGKDNDYIILRSVWNESDIIEIEFAGIKVKVDGGNLISSIQRVIGRRINQTD